MVRLATSSYLWNYIWVDVPPLADVLVAIFLSILAYQFNLKLKK